MKYAITTNRAPEAIGAYSQGTTAARFVFTSGQLGMDPKTGELLEGIEAQTDRAISNIEAILAEVDLTLSDVTKVTVFITDMGNFDKVNKTYAKRFPKPEPARSVVEVGALPKGGLVEIECIACR